MTLEELNAATGPDARAALLRCCGSDRWAREVAARRPFIDRDALHRVADAVWWSLEPKDWREAFSHHPRIGERGTAWSNDEQSGARAAGGDTLARLARRNHDYERRFGHVFLICATGRSAEEILANLERRMGNAPGEELRVAAGEQAAITRLRLDKLLSTTSP